MTSIWYILVILMAPCFFCVLYGFIVAYKLYHPYRKPRYEVPIDGKDMQKLRIPSSHGVELDGLLLSSDGSNNLVLITHEIGSFKESKLKIARWLVSEGFSVLLFDLRNHGASSKDRSLWPMSERFTDDIEAALNFVRKNLPAIQILTLFSFSFSTLPALYILNRQLEQPNNIILDSGPSLMLKALFGKFLDEFGRVLGLVPRVFKNPVFYPLFRRSFQFFGLRMLAAAKWPPDLSKANGKILFITNGKDPIFSEEEMRSVADQVLNNQVWVCSKSSHLQAYSAEPKQYQKVLLNFLQQKTVAPK